MTDGMKYVLPLIAVLVIAFVLFKSVSAAILNSMGIDSQVIVYVVSANLTGLVLLITSKIWHKISGNKSEKGE